MTAGFPGAKVAVDGGLGHRETLRAFEKALLLYALEEHGWNQCAAAQALGMHRNTFGLRKRKLGIRITGKLVKRKRVTANHPPAPPVLSSPPLRG